MLVRDRSVGALRPCPRRSIAYEAQPAVASACCQYVHTEAEFAAPWIKITGGRSTFVVGSEATTPITIHAPHLTSAPSARSRHASRTMSVWAEPARSVT